MYDCPLCVCVCAHVNNLTSLRKKRKEKKQNNINPKQPNLVQFEFVLR